jgi:hypothetical protein
VSGRADRRPGRAPSGWPSFHVHASRFRRSAARRVMGHLPRLG